MHLYPRFLGPDPQSLQKSNVVAIEEVDSAAGDAFEPLGFHLGLPDLDDNFSFENLLQYRLDDLDFDGPVPPPLASLEDVVLPGGAVGPAGAGATGPGQLSHDSTATAQAWTSTLSLPLPGYGAFGGATDAGPEGFFAAQLRDLIPPATATLNLSRAPAAPSQALGGGGPGFGMHMHLGSPRGTPATQHTQAPSLPTDFFADFLLFGGMDGHGSGGGRASPWGSGRGVARRSTFDGLVDDLLLGREALPHGGGL